MTTTVNSAADTGLPGIMTEQGEIERAEEFGRLIMQMSPAELREFAVYVDGMIEGAKREPDAEILSIMAGKVRELANTREFAAHLEAQS